ncbi:hypothetical protein EYF80_030706 [Liparis tanakae]|uniref:Uncharacterized protein n=1 Tax=Liparis tanakae TaxID=230148 RepID=A0A4Z2H2H8_9TELE|nr:hypothetical protein EYF80_030706 [Liparis tanakae]
MAVWLASTTSFFLTWNDILFQMFGRSPMYLTVSSPDPRRRNKLAMLLEDFPVLVTFLASPTCMRTTVDVVKALRTFFSGLASMMYT